MGVGEGFRLWALIWVQVWRESFIQDEVVAKWHV